MRQYEEEDLIHSLSVFMYDSTQYKNKGHKISKYATDYILKNNLSNFKLESIINGSFALSNLKPNVIKTINRDIFPVLGKQLLGLDEYHRLLKSTYDRNTQLEFTIKTQMLYKGLYQSYSLAPNEFVKKAFTQHQESLNQFLNDCESKNDLYSYVNLASAICNNKYALNDINRFSSIPYNAEIMRKLLKTILYIGKDEAFHASEKQIFMTLYALKSMIMYQSKQGDKTSEESKHFEKQIKRVIKLFIDVLLKSSNDRFAKLNQSDKIRVLFEGINLRVLTPEDIKNQNILSFIESMHVEHTYENQRTKFDKYAGDSKLIKMGTIDLFNMVGILTSSIMYRTLNEYYYEDSLINLYKGLVYALQITSKRIDKHSMKMQLVNQVQRIDYLLSKISQGKPHRSSLLISFLNPASLITSPNPKCKPVSYRLRLQHSAPTNAK